MNPMNINTLWNALQIHQLCDTTFSCQQSAGQNTAYKWSLHLFRDKFKVVNLSSWALFVHCTVWSLKAISAYSNQKKMSSNIWTNPTKQSCTVPEWDSYTLEWVFVMQLLSENGLQVNQLNILKGLEPNDPRGDVVEQLQHQCCCCCCTFQTSSSNCAVLNLNFNSHVK